VVEESGVVLAKLRTLQRFLFVQDPEHKEENKIQNVSA
jgi:hypothetical protein